MEDEEEGTAFMISDVGFTHLPNAAAHICVSESGQHWFR